MKFKKFLRENSLILLLISIFIKDKIHKRKFEVNHSSIDLNKESSSISYFLLMIIFTRKLAKSKSCFLAFHSSF